MLLLLYVIAFICLLVAPLDDVLLLYVIAFNMLYNLHLTGHIWICDLKL